MDNLPLLLEQTSQQISLNCFSSTAGSGRSVLGLKTVLPSEVSLSKSSLILKKYTIHVAFTVQLFKDSLFIVVNFLCYET